MPDFSNKSDYNKWLAYGHMHGDFKKAPGNEKVSISGEHHKVNHGKDCMNGMNDIVNRTNVK